jgi:CHAT domain
MSEARSSGSSRYTSILVELIRHGADEGIFRPDIPYMVQIGDKPVTEFRVPLKHVHFLQHMQGLDYHATPETNAKSLEALSAVVTDVLLLPEIGASTAPIQIDLVVTAGELAALPFELAKDDKGGWLLATAGRDVEITRRTRLDLGHRLERWRAKPRVLFVAAAPSDDTVPVKEHTKALCKALQPWIEPLKGGPTLELDPREVLEVIEGASLAAIRTACEKAAECGKPFTHVHFLAHGLAIGPHVEQRFGLSLLDENHNRDAVDGVDIAKALEPIIGECSVVTFATCYGGKETNTILPGSSLAQTLHAAGIPVVVGCQFPMTTIGSTLFTERFFTPLFLGEDVRAALHAARKSLYERRDDTGHDWAGLVGYVRLPETYAVHLIDVALEIDLACLRTAQKWFDLVVKTAGPTDAPNPKVLDGIGRQVRKRIDRLDRRRADAEASGRKGVLEENLGLLGSAEKRFAEIQFRLWTAKRSDDRYHAMRDALGRSHDWYRQAFRRNLSHHWSGVQMLALSAALEGRITDENLWSATMTAAKIAMEDQSDYWAAGTLAETYLLAPLAGQSGAEALGLAAEALEQLVQRTRRHCKDRFPIESTLRQLWRYRYWWTERNGFFAGGQDLTQETGKLLDVLNGPSNGSGSTAR